MIDEKIFVILGTQKFQLDRLLIIIDRLVEKNILKNVFAQIGESKYKPKNYEFKEFLTNEEFERKVEESTLVIAHGGVGSILSAVKKGKKVLVFPRLSKYNEHVDDHQCEIGKTFETRNLVLYCGEEDNLEEKLEELRNKKFDKFIPNNQKIIDIIQSYIKETGEW